MLIFILFLFVLFEEASKLQAPELLRSFSAPAPERESLLLQRSKLAATSGASWLRSLLHSKMLLWS